MVVGIILVLFFLSPVLGPVILVPFVLVLVVVLLSLFFFLFFFFLFLFLFCSLFSGELFRDGFTGVQYLLLSGNGCPLYRGSLSSKPHEHSEV